VHPGDGLNEAGQVSYRFTLADGYQGIAIWSPNAPGDYNDDGFVDTGDYVLWRKNEGTQTNYQTWRANFGKAARTGAAESIQIPETTSIVSSLIATRMFWGRRSSRCGDIRCLFFF
jgi:hypothetical protein